MECRFGPEIIKKNQNNMLGKMFQVRPIKVHNLLQKNQTYTWYQYDVSLAEHRLVGPLKFGTAGRKKLKYSNMINVKQWKELKKEGPKKRINTSETKYVMSLER